MSLFTFYLTFAGGLLGIRSLEVTYRCGADKYHAHYHVIVECKAPAEFVVAQWLKHWDGLAVRKAQDIRPADAHSYNELFKYATKVTVKGEEDVVPAEALDVIFPLGRLILRLRLLFARLCV